MQPSMIAMHCIDADAIFNYIMFAARPTVDSQGMARTGEGTKWCGSAIRKRRGLMLLFRFESPLELMAHDMNDVFEA